MKKMTLLKIILVLPALLLTGCQKQERIMLSLSFTGDIMMHIPVKNCAARANRTDPEKKISLNNEGYDFLFERIRPTLLKSDLVLGNMEFPVAAPYTSEPWIFNCPKSVLPAMKLAGFTLVTIANNHMLDQGADGAITTMKNLRESGLPFIGAGASEPEARQGLVLERKGVRVGYIAYTGVSNYPIPKNRKDLAINWFYDEEKVKEDIRAMRTRCDYLVLSVHAGVEYDHQPQARDGMLMKKYLDEGADIVIGHHPHVLQPVERYRTVDGRDTVICYSLGNFISNQRDEVPMYNGKLRQGTRDSMIVTVIIEKTKEGLVKTFSTTPIVTVNRIDTASGGRVIQTMPAGSDLASNIKPAAAEKPADGAPVAKPAAERLYE
jgi:poly-gamma-glutamate synthesis protein (capsule biosynthesis protein)